MKQVMCMKWSASKTVYFVVLFALYTSTGCDGEAEDVFIDGGDALSMDLGFQDGVDLSGDPLALMQFSLVENPANVLSYYVDWQTNKAADTQLSLTCDGLFDSVAIQQEEGVGWNTEHSVFIMGLARAAFCEVTVSSETADGEKVTHQQQFQVSETLPERLPEMDAEIYMEDQLEAGWTLFVVSEIDASGMTEVIGAIVDEQGRYRWYYVRNELGPGDNGWDAYVTEQGVMLGGRPGSPQAVEVAWNGSEVWVAPFSMHHDIQPSPLSDSALLYLGKSTTGCPEGTNEGTVNEYLLDTEVTEWTWHLCEHYTPPEVYPDWSHINDIEHFPGTRSLLISVRNQNTLFRIDRDSGEIEWGVGQYGDFEMDLDALFQRQHAPQILEEGTILLFDNGWLGEEQENESRGYSRAVEYALNFDAEGEPLSAEIVWGYEDTALFAKSRSEADRLGNGNTLLTYSVLDDTRESLLREVTPSGEVVWDLRTPSGWNVYRSERIHELSYGFILLGESD